MARDWRTVKVFISSTFKDMQAERDHLVRFVFPKLREELLQRRIHLVDVDLRWGVTSDQDVLGVCREIIDECRPRFVCMLGGRYGWTPPGQEESITAAEIRYALEKQDYEKEYRFFYFRDPAATAAVPERVALGVGYREFPTLEDTYCYGPVEATALAWLRGSRLEALKQEIEAAGFQPFLYPARWDEATQRLIDLEEFGERVYQNLLSSIDEELGTAAPEELDEFAKENAAQEAFLEERLARYVVGSRQTLLDELTKFAAGYGQPNILVLTGAPGSGKSALLGRFYRDYARNHPDALVIPHFVGASPGSTNLRLTLRRFCHELSRSLGLPEEIPQDIRKLLLKFRKLLEQAGSALRVVIIIDAVNQMDAADNAHAMFWLPYQLPPKVRFVVSTLKQETEEHQTLQTLRRRQKQIIEKVLKPLEEEDRLAIIQEFLHRYRKKLEPEQVALLLEKPESGSPLYLLTALEELRTLGTHDEITAHLQKLPGQVPLLFTWIFQRLEQDPGFRDDHGQPIGQELVQQCLSLLGVSRFGLSELELKELLAPAKIPDSLGNVAAMVRLLRPYLMQRGELLDCYHQQFREATIVMYLKSEQQEKDAHAILATYFRSKTDPAGNYSWAGSNSHALLELPYHQSRGEMWDLLERTLSDLKFIEVRCLEGTLYKFIQDLDDSFYINPLPTLACIRGAINHAKRAMVERPELTMTSLYNRLRWCESPTSALSEALERANHLLNQCPWICAAAMMPGAQTSNRLTVTFNHSMMQSLSVANRKLAVASLSGEVSIFDLDVGEVIMDYLLETSLKGIALGQDGLNLAYIDQTGRIGLSQTNARLAGRPGEAVLALHPVQGVFAMRSDLSLVCWDFLKNKTDILAKNLPVPLIVLRISSDGRKVLFVAGYQHQAMGISTLDDSVWTTKLFPSPFPPAIDASVDPGFGIILLATVDRRLSILEVDEGKCLAQVFYARRADSLLRGAPEKCTLGFGTSEKWAFIGTDSGQVGAWNWWQDEFVSLEPYRAPKENTSLVILEVFTPDGELFITTNDQGKIYTSYQPINNDIKLTMPVSACRLTNGNKVVATSEMDYSIRWFSFDGLVPEGLESDSFPSALAIGSTPDEIFWGNRKGIVWRLRLGSDAKKEFWFDLGEPVVSLFYQEENAAVIVAGLNGAVVRYNPAFDRQEVLWASTGHQQQIKILSAGTRGLFWNFYRDDNSGFVISLVTDVNRETRILTLQSRCNLAVATDCGSICVAGKEVRIFRPIGKRWESIFTRRIGVDLLGVGFLSNDAYLNVVLKGSRWLEVWQVAPGLPTAAAIDLPVQVTCTDTRGNHIIAGCQSGDLMSFSLQGLR